MKIVVFGATGGTGSKVVERALADGHEVVAAARRPDAVTTKHDKLRVAKTDVLDAEAVEGALEGADAIISTIGPADEKNPGTLISRGVANITAGAKKKGVRRFVFESGLMVGDGRGLSLLGRMLVSIFRSTRKALCEDKRVAEATIRASDLDWVIVRPPTLKHDPPKGGYKFGVDARIDVTKSMSHADAAEFLIRAATNADLVRTIQDVGY
ncbi:MAG TPA: NAD(P)H-binding protein [Polyangiaceae bacterium]|jgi:uncharacterized protein YbjT (DUF2867 family)